MKTTVEIESELLRRAKRVALDRRTSLKAVLESGLRRELAAEHAPKCRKLRLVTHPGGLPPGLDLDSRRRMWDWISQDQRQG